MCKKLNCWEYNNCGREPGGLMAEIHGVCPVAEAMRFDGLNDGQAAGRVCWMIPNSACRLKTARGRNSGCHSCKFYLRVAREQSDETKFAYHSKISR